MGLFDFGASQIAASQQRDFTERMFKSRYQNTMADMRAAGLNPILAAKLGGGTVGAGAAAAPANIDKGVLDWRMQAISRRTARTNASMAEAQLRIKNAEAIIAERDAKAGTTPSGVAGAEARNVPSALIPAAAYGINRMAEYPFAPGTNAKHPHGPTQGRRSKNWKYQKGYGKTQDIFGGY